MGTCILFKAPRGKAGRRTPESKLYFVFYIHHGRNLNARPMSSKRCGRCHLKEQSSEVWSTHDVRKNCWKNEVWEIINLPLGPTIHIQLTQLGQQQQHSCLKLHSDLNLSLIDHFCLFVEGSGGYAAKLMLVKGNEASEYGWLFPRPFSS